jgi:serine/threonine protein kinase
MQPQPASPTHLLALPDGTELVGEFRITRVLGAGGFGITYLATETALAREVTIKEYFPLDYAARGASGVVAPRSRDSAKDYQWGLERFLEEAQTLARFNHPNIVRVYRCFRARDTGYMVLHFEEGGSFKAWLKGLQRAPRQSELDRIVAPLLDALEVVHSGNYLHRDIAPDNIIIRKDGAPVLIDFGSARGDMATHSKTVSALVKPGYSPYEQYATTTSNQGAWTDIYALGATLYHAISGRRPPDAPSRMVNDEYVCARDAALSSYRAGFLAAVDKALRLEIGERPQSIAQWRGPLLAPDPKRAGLSLRKALERVRTQQPSAQQPSAQQPSQGAIEAPTRTPPPEPAPAVADLPRAKGELLDFVAARKRRRAARAAAPAPGAAPARSKSPAANAVKLDCGSPPATPPQVSPRRTPGAAHVGASAARPAQIVRAPPRPRRRHVWRLPSRQWRRLSYKLLIGLTIAGLAVAYQESLPRVEGRGGSMVASQSAELAAVLRLAGHKGAVTGVASADQGRWIVSCGSDATLRVWNSGSGALVRTIELDDGPATALAVDERRALTGHDSGAIVLWDLERAEKLASFQADARVTNLAFAGGVDVAATTQAGSLALFDAHTPSASPTLLIASEGSAELMAAAPGADLLATAAADGARLWRISTRVAQRALRGHDGRLTALAIADDGRILASGAASGSVRLMSTGSYRHQRLFRAHAGRVTALAFARGERLLASAGDDGLVKLWDLRGGRPRIFPGHAGAVPALAFSTDGRRILSAGEDGVIRVFTTEPALAAR